MKKWMILGAMALASLCALTACDAAAPSAPSQTASQPVSVPQEPPEINWEVQEAKGDSIIEIPKFVLQGEENPALEDLNTQIDQNHTKLYDEWKKNPDSVQELEIKGHTFTDENYVQIVMTQLEFPTYGTQGDIFSYNYDVKNRKVVTLEEALAKFNRSSEDLLSSMEFSLPNNTTVSRSELQGFLLLTNGKLNCYAKVFFTNSENAPEGDYNMLYTIQVDPASDTVTTTPFEGPITPDTPSSQTSSTTASA